MAKRAASTAMGSPLSVTVPAPLSSFSTSITAPVALRSSLTCDPR